MGTERRIVFDGPKYIDQDGWLVTPHVDALTKEEVGQLATKPVDAEILAQMPHVKTRRRSLLRRVINQIGENLGFR